MTLPLNRCLLPMLLLAAAAPRASSQDAPPPAAPAGAPEAAPSADTAQLPYRTEVVPTGDDSLDG
ncbi:MAG TPA: hypothetical protein VE690_01700, partial [Rhodopila sp.]|nr:hypothetical protein [Rhodopila sp.]